MKLRLPPLSGRLMVLAALLLGVLALGSTGAAWASEWIPPGSTVPERIADLTVNKTGSRSGNQVTFTITMRNLGGGVARNAVLVDVIPASLRIVSVTPSGVQRSCTVRGQLITCRVTDVLWADPDHFLRVRVVTRIVDSRARTVTNTAIVSSSTRDPRPGNNSDTVTVKLK